MTYHKAVQDGMRLAGASEEEITHAMAHLDILMPSRRELSEDEFQWVKETAYAQLLIARTATPEERDALLQEAHADALRIASRN